MRTSFENQVMKAMIFAAGLGTRLKPLTLNKPKAMVSINGKPLLQHVIEKLIKHGFTEIVINIHHFGEQILRFLEQKDYFGITIQVSDERDQLLDTGGGLKKAAPLFDQQGPVLIHNVDILSSINLNQLYKAHQQQDAAVTLAVSNRPASRVLLFDADDQLCGWRNKKSGKEKIIRQLQYPPQEYAFSGIHVIDPSFPGLIIEEGVFSIIEVYLRLTSQIGIKPYIHTNDFWIDMGTPDHLKKAEEWLQKHEI